jgi:hypothetical protein
LILELRHRKTRGLLLGLRLIRKGLLERDKEESKDWTVAVYKGSDAVREEAELEEDMLELELDEDDTVKTSKVLGIAVFYYRKSYNPQYLSSDMINVWGIQKLAAVEKIHIQAIALWVRLYNVPSAM